MSKTDSGAKKAGKALTAVVILILLNVFAASWFIGGQTTVLEKYCAAVTSGSFSQYVKTVPPDDRYAGGSESDFIAACESGIKGLPEFSELDSTDTISSKVKITSHKMNGSFSQWVCTADIDFFGGGSSISYDNVSVTMSFTGGKWIIISTEPNVF
ncbi:MAG: hypothetical protein MSJ26_11850 [Oscillospiraceae bacterium]|nr:hypothetical protein [Oscillospiraceae bacterium]